MEFSHFPIVTQLVGRTGMLIKAIVIISQPACGTHSPPLSCLDRRAWGRLKSGIPGRPAGVPETRPGVVVNGVKGRMTWISGSRPD